MQNSKKQINKLYLMNAIGNGCLAGAAWVAVLASAGYSAAEIGICETIFHAVSLAAEIPSGVSADVFGRKKMMILSGISALLAGLMKAFSMGNFWIVALSMVFSALSYNLASGSDAALAYESLKADGLEDSYNRYSANSSVIYRVFSGVATLLAGFTVTLGMRRAELLDVAMMVVHIAIALSLKEIRSDCGQSIRVWAAIKNCYVESFRFLRSHMRIFTTLVVNSLIGATDTLLLFFLQEEFTEAGVSIALLGPALFVTSMGGVVGSLVSKNLKTAVIKKVEVICALGVCAGFATGLTEFPVLMVIGGFISSMFDDMIQIKTDVMLNDSIPSEQRSTLISVSSFLFSCVMIVLSPVVGVVFSVF